MPSTPFRTRRLDRPSRPFRPAAVCLAALALTACSGDAAEEAENTAREWQQDMQEAIEPLLIQYEEDTGTSRNLWLDGPMAGGCERDGARARLSYHFEVPTADKDYGQLVDEALETALIHGIAPPPNLDEDELWNNGHQITETANDGESFHRVVEYRRDGYILTLIVHAAAGEGADQLVLVVDAYSTCV